MSFPPLWLIFFLYQQVLSNLIMMCFSITCLFGEGGSCFVLYFLCLCFIEPLGFVFYGFHRVWKFFSHDFFRFCFLPLLFLVLLLWDTNPYSGSLETVPQFTDDHLINIFFGCSGSSLWHAGSLAVV